MANITTNFQNLSDINAARQAIIASSINLFSGMSYAQLAYSNGNFYSFDRYDERSATKVVHNSNDTVTSNDYVSGHDYLSAGYDDTLIGDLGADNFVL